MFEGEEIEVKLEVEGVIENEKREHEEAKKRFKEEADEGNGGQLDTRTPEEYQRYVTFYKIIPS